jgi:FAD:protein FMN transferase
MSIYSQQFAAMGGTSNEVRLEADNAVLGNGLIQLAIAEVLRIEAKFSRYRTDSVVTQINENAGGDWLSADSETIALARYANTLHEASDGLFDLTSGVLRQAWNFKTPILPQRESLQLILQRIDQTQMQLQDNCWRLAKAHMELDFGGIGKEYAADRAALILQEQGVQFAYVNLGGDIAVVGPKPDGKPWSIAIPKPRKPKSTLAAIAMTQGGIATSGDYERFFELDGKRYCHILSAKTGMPVSYWQSVTVVGPTASAAGSCSSIAMLLEARGLAFLQDSGLSFLAIDHAGKLHKSDSKN